MIPNIYVLLNLNLCVCVRGIMLMGGSWGEWGPGNQRPWSMEDSRRWKSTHTWRGSFGGHPQI